MSATYDMCIDSRTGAITLRGTNGRTYTMDEYDAARSAAARGDADATATIAAIERPAPTSPADARRMMEEVMDDCPLCQELKAKGEWDPVSYSTEDLSPIDAWIANLPREAAPRPPNWWHGRRPKKRGRR